MMVISTVCESIGSISFRYHSRSLRQRSRAKGKQSYGSFGACWIIFGSDLFKASAGARNGSLTSRLHH